MSTKKKKITVRMRKEGSRIESSAPSKPHLEALKRRDSSQYASFLKDIESIELSPDETEEKALRKKALYKWAKGFVFAYGEAFDELADK
jgi:hypothetical protein